MNRWLGKVAIVPGASGGIGAQITEQLIDHGLMVVGLARRKEKLAELEQKCRGKKGKFYYFATDIGKKEDVVKASQWVKQNLGVVNILVNNTRINRFSPLMEGNNEHISDIMDANVFELCFPTQEAIKEMQNNKVDGHIININHKVLGSDSFNLYSEVLRKKLSNSKIKVSSISGYVQTKIIDTTMKNTDGYTEEDIKAIHIKDYYLKTTHSLHPKNVADALIYILSAPPHVQINDLFLTPSDGYIYS